MALIREKLPVTQGSTISMVLLIINLQKLLEPLFVFLANWLKLIFDDEAAKIRQSVLLGVQIAAA